MPSASSGSRVSSMSVSRTVCPESPFSIKTPENTGIPLLYGCPTSLSSALGGVPQGALGLQILLEAGLTPLPSVAAALVPAERCIEVESMVDRHPAGADPAGHRAGLVQVGPRNVTGQAILGVVGDLDRFLDVVVAEYAQHRSEDLLTGDRHVVDDVGEDGRFDVVATIQPVRTAGAAGHDGRTVVDAAGDQP